MNKHFRNERGMTLVEVLAAFTVATLLMTFIVSIYFMIQKQYTQQSQNIQHQTDITIAVKAITKDLRSADNVIVNEQNDSITILKTDEPVIYRLEDEVIQKNDTDFIFDIEGFHVEKSESKIILQIQSKNNKNLHTEIVLREGDGSDDEIE